MKDILLENQRGISLITVVLILLIVGLIGAVFVSLITTESFMAMNQASGLQALSIADSGIEKAVYQYKTGTACGSLSYTNSLGAGSFTTTGVLYNPSPPTTLSSGIGVGDTTIPVVSTAGYAPHGRITIQSEDIDYTGTSTAVAVCGAGIPACFTGAIRGANGTTPAVHAAGKHVHQKQCLITSTGTVPGPLSSTQRKVEVSVR